MSRVRHLFLEALALDPEASRRLLDRECVGDEELRGELERLLELDGVQDSFLDRPLPVEAMAELLEATAGGRTGQVGPYRLMEELGRGGMGVVFRAVRNDGHFEHEVAVKILSTLVLDRGARSRFESERQILARLDHPYIATLFDGGLIEGRVPYYVMRLVRGEPIDRFCDGGRLGIEERLEPFLKVCEAVQFAHDRLIVHRDLKPDNILVSEDGNPRLLDFGIATLLSDGTTGELGRAGSEWAMTPGYASPEQLRGETVTTASDVYSLGVVLYQLLAGRLPFPTEGRSPEGLAGIVVRLPVTRPSDAVLGAEARRVARDRGSTPARLRRELAGDLDEVVAKALRADPGGRYQSVRELAAEVRRYLDGFPVEARPASFVRRTAKLVRRNRAASALAAALATVLLGAGALLALQNLEIRRERDLAREVTGFLVGLFQVSDPSQARGHELTAKDVLDRGAERLGSELAENPELRAHLAATIGVVYQNLGLFDEARSQLKLALELRRGLHGRDHPDVAASASDLGNLLRNTGELAQAEELLREALDLRLRLDGPRALETAVTRNDLALVLLDQDRFDEAEALVRDALEVLQADHPAVRGEIGDLSVTLGVLLLERGELDEAEERLRFGREVRQELGEDLPLLAQAENNLGEALRQGGRYQEAEELLTRAVASRRRLLGDRHPGLATSLSNLALVHYERGQLETAGVLLTEACEIFRSSVGADHPGYAASLNNLAALHFKTGDLEAAEETFREVLSLRLASVGESHSDTAQALQNLGVALRARGKVEEAFALLRRALEIRLEVFGPQDARVASTQENLATTLFDLGQPGRAEELYREAIAALEVALPAVHPTQARIRTRLAKLLVEQGRLREARELLEATEGIWARSSGEDPALLAEARSLLVTCLSGLGQVSDAGAKAAELAESLGGVAFSDPRTEREVLTRLIDFFSEFSEHGAGAQLEPLRSRRAALGAS